MKQLTLAAAQITCQDGKVPENLARATSMAEQAKIQGAQLVLFPEFMPQGYLLTPALWDSAEPFDGPTTRWLAETARRLGIYLGTSFLEARDGHFLNTFVLAEPSGKIVGAVRKRNPSMWEAYFFKGERGAPYIDTDLGRIGVGICFDNHTYELASAIQQSNVDLMLMPHSYCTPTQTTKLIAQADIDQLNGRPGLVARLYNEWFGVPALMCNKSGAWDSPVPDTTLGVPKDFRFSGRSALLDSDGTLRGELGDEEAVLVGTVTLDPALKKQTRPPKYSRYIYPGSAGREIIRLMEWRGSLSYTFSKLRKAKALSFAK
ncbi:MAG: carbon-nitrogen hydrolase family protein [Anaerolineales bacterium]|nr:carbon-nitrogen hydrolase family protein [Anaerolineales bacterium]